MRTGERVGPAEHLKLRREFQRVQRGGERRVGRYVVAIALPGKESWTRLGLTVSRKVGNAVVRNRIKRRLREIFRRNKGSFPDGLDIVLIARAEARSASTEDLKDEVLALCRKLTGKRRKRRRRGKSRRGPHSDS